MREGVTLKILVLEDSDSCFVLSRRYIEKSAEMCPGVSVEIERKLTAREAEDALAAGSWDMAFVDLNVPDSAGMGTIERVRAAAGGVPVVVISGADKSSVDARRLSELKVTFLEKDLVHAGDVGVASNAFRLLLVGAAKRMFQKS